MAVGILAARSNTSVAAGAITSVQAGLIQSQLAYTRDFEREADRMGYQTLEKAGFDVRGMGSFERLQSAGRLYENNAPVYLRSHPLTVERLSDMPEPGAGVAVSAGRQQPGFSSDPRQVAGSVRDTEESCLRV